MVFWIIATVVVFTFSGMLYLYKTRNNRGGLDDYITARHHLGTFPAAATIFASCMGVWVLMTPPETATWGGISAFGGYAIAQAVAIMLFAVLGSRIRELAPQGSTLFEFVFYRFGKGMYAIVLVIGVFYMSVFLAAELTGIATAANLVAGIPLWATALAVGGGALIYTTYGGIRGSIFTDTIQVIIIIPVILIAFVSTAYFMGGFGEVASNIREVSPELLSFEHIGGLKFAATMGIAVISAGLFNQGFWSRVYACKDGRTVRRSFLIAGLLIIPIMIIAGSFGILAVTQGELQSPSAALFEVVMNATPQWVLTIVIILAVALVMSSVDTMINAIAAVFTVDIARFNPGIDQSKLQKYARVITAVICGIIIIVSSQGFSVLYLFLLADLACAAAVFPTFYGLYSRRFPGWAGMVSIGAGIAAGVPFFPGPSMQGGDLLYSFLFALMTSIILSVVLEKTSKVELSFEALSKKVHDIKS